MNIILFSVEETSIIVTPDKKSLDFRTVRQSTPCQTKTKYEIEDTVEETADAPFLNDGEESFVQDLVHDEGGDIKEAGFEIMEREVIDALDTTRVDTGIYGTCRCIRGYVLLLVHFVSV